jgi:hypothetical protein
VTDEQKKLLANFLNGIAIAAVNGAAIGPIAAYVIGTSAIASPNWWNIAGFVVFMLVVALLLHVTALRIVGTVE